MKRTTLSFLTESKASHVSLLSIRRVTITLLVMLLTTASAIAQNDYWLTLDDNYEGGASTMIRVSISANTITLTKNFEPTRTGYTFYGWSDLPTGVAKYRTGDKVTLDGNLTLYAVWYILNYTINDEGKKQVELSGYEGEKPSGTLNIPATVTINGKEYSVTSIGNNAFWGCSSLQSVTIPNRVTSIGNNAFRGCSNLMSITIPNSVKHIGNSVFRACTSLQSVIIPESVTNIEKYVFKACTSLQSVTIPNSVTRIGDAAFDACTSLRSITIPNSVSTIGDGAFSGCSNLKSVTIPNSVTTIGDDAFRYCI